PSRSYRTMASDRAQSISTEETSSRRKTRSRKAWQAAGLPASIRRVSRSRITPSAQEMTGSPTRWATTDRPGPGAASAGVPFTYTTPQGWANRLQPPEGGRGGTLRQLRCRPSQVELIGDLLDETNRSLAVAIRGEHPGRQRELGVDGEPPRGEGDVHGQQLRLD